MVSDNRINYETYFEHDLNIQYTIVERTIIE
jgi:hypothetical protein